jgi:hypothetical protein
MDEVGTGFGPHATGGFISCGDRGLAEGYLRAVTFDSAEFYGWSVSGHDYPGFYAAPGTGTGDGGAVIAARLGDYTVGDFGIGKGEYGVRGTTYFEGTGFLEIIAFEKNVGAGELVERRTGEYGSAMYFSSDASVSFFDGIPRRRGEIFYGGGLWVRIYVSRLF